MRGNIFNHRLRGFFASLGKGLASGLWRAVCRHVGYKSAAQISTLTSISIRNDVAVPALRCVRDHNGAETDLRPSPPTTLHRGGARHQGGQHHHRAHLSGHSHQCSPRNGRGDYIGATIRDPRMSPMRSRISARHNDDSTSCCRDRRQLGAHRGPAVLEHPPIKNDLPLRPRHLHFI